MYRIYWESRGKLVSVRLNNLEWAREVAKNHDGRVEREYTVEDAEREIIREKVYNYIQRKQKARKRFFRWQTICSRARPHEVAAKHSKRKDY